MLHPEEALQFPCPFCGREFRGRSQLSNHRNSCAIKSEKRALLAAKLEERVKSRSKENGDAESIEQRMPRKYNKMASNGGESSSVKRSLRNRIRKSYKDFIYDMPEATQATPFSLFKAPKRRNTIQEMNAPDIKQEPGLEPPPEKKPCRKVRGSAFTMASDVVNKSKAIFKDHPKLNTQPYDALSALPIPRRRSIRKSINLVDLTSLEEGGASIKLEDTTSDASTENEDKEVKCPTDKEFKQYFVTNRLSEPVKKVLLMTPEL